MIFAELPGFLVFSLLPLSLNFFIFRMAIIAVPLKLLRYMKGAWSSAGHIVSALSLVAVVDIIIPIVVIISRL